MYKMLMKSCNAFVEIDSDIDLYEIVKDKIDFIDFPEITIEKYNNNEKSKYIVKYMNSNERILQYEEHNVVIKYPIKEMEDGLTILFIAYPLLEVNRREKKSLTCHCAGVSINGKGILILGKEGAGKTTLAIELCRKYNAKLIGNDLCVIDYNYLNNLKLLGGTKYIFLRYESIKRNIPELLKKFDLQENDKKIDTWTLKKKFFSKDLGIQVEKNEVSIDSIFIVHIDQEKDFFCKETNSLADILYINENFSRYIRNTCTTMINNNNIIGYIPSLDSKEFYMQRKELINYLFNNKKIKYLSGNIDDVSKYIINGGKK